MQKMARQQERTQTSIRLYVPFALATSVLDELTGLTGHVAQGLPGKGHGRLGFVALLKDHIDGALDANILKVFWWARSGQGFLLFPLWFVAKRGLWPGRRRRRGEYLKAICSRRDNGKQKEKEQHLHGVDWMGQVRKYNQSRS